MKLHNSYTLRTKSGDITALNSVSENFWQNAAIYPKWANYIFLSADDGSAVYAPAKLEFVNCNPLSGGSYRAVYSASVECLQKHYIGVGLSCAEQAGYEMSAASVDFTSGVETADITATVYLSVAEADNVCFCGGDNPLIRRLLGCGGEMQMSIGWGECNYPSRVCVRTKDLIEELLPAVVSGGSDGLKIKTESPAYGCELILYCGDTPLMRALRPYDYDIKILYKTLDEHAAVLLDENPPETIYNVKLDGTAMLRVDTCKVVDKIVPIFGDYIRNLGAEGSVETDPAGEYIAFVSAAYVEVYKVDCIDLTFVVRIPKTNEYVYMLRGGAVALWSSTALTIYEPDENGEYSPFSVSMPTGNSQIVVREGNRYHGLCKRSMVVARFKCSRNEGLTIMEQIKVAASQCFLGRCGDAVMYADTKVTARMLDTDLSAEFACEEMEKRGYVRTMTGIGDCFAATSELGETVIYDLVHNKLLKPGETLKANGKLLYNDESVYVYDYYNGVRKIDGNFDMSGVTGACIAGDGLFVVRGGKLYSYYMSGSKVAVRMPAKSEGKQAYMNVREKLLKGIGSGATFALTPAQTAQ